jgi:hypothetical protein
MTNIERKTINASLAAARRIREERAAARRTADPKHGDFGGIEELPDFLNWPVDDSGIIAAMRDAREERE